MNESEKAEEVEIELPTLNWPHNLQSNVAGNANNKLVYINALVAQIVSERLC
jgi:hypothetical protein